MHIYIYSIYIYSRYSRYRRYLHHMYIYASERGSTQSSRLGSNMISGTTDAQALKLHFSPPPPPHRPPPPVFLWPVSSLRTCGLDTLEASHMTARERLLAHFFFLVIPQECLAYASSARK